jgi:DNA-directed RNA polymerase specialized sigma24 family protein
MDDHRLVQGLRSRTPGALAAVYDAYAGRLYAYCWFRLLSHDAAQTALGDAFIVARARIDQLREHDRLGPWLFAIARLECGRQAPGIGRQPDLTVAEPGQADADRRLTAWRAVMALPPLGREVLDLRFRHRLSIPDLAMIMGLPVTHAESIVDRARTELEAAVAAEILAHTGRQPRDGGGGDDRPPGCEECAEILRERRGALTADLSERLLRHARECQACRARRPRTVSTVKVYDLLPMAAPPGSLRPRVLNGFLDPTQIGYRLSVVTRAGPFAPNGFPAQARWTRRGRRTDPGHLAGEELGPAGGYRIMLGVAAALAVMIGLYLVPWFIRSGGPDAGPAKSSATPNGPAGHPAPPIARTPSIGRAEQAFPPVAAPFPLGTRPAVPVPWLMTLPSPQPVGRAPGPRHPWQPAPPPDEGPPPSGGPPTEDPPPSAPPSESPSCPPSQAPSPAPPPASPSPSGSPSAAPSPSDPAPSHGHAS